MSRAFRVADEVGVARKLRNGVVALETSVIGQGLPVPENRECIERMNAAVRASGAVPAWIGVVDGTVTVGLDRRAARPVRGARRRDEGRAP